jgi:hypothetical protein
MGVLEWELDIWKRAREACKRQLLRFRYGLVERSGIPFQVASSLSLVQARPRAKLVVIVESSGLA